ncbi:MAG: IS110 family transposase [Polyangiales bacterium]
MGKRRTYNSVDVERIDIELLMQLVMIGCIIAVDIAKSKMMAAVATAAGEVRQLIRFEHPRQTALFLGMVDQLHRAELAPRVVMEPTGTYGDALRYQFHRRGVPVQMLSPKHTHDFGEVVDGVPSMHDAKSAVVLARLAALPEMRKKVAWQPDDDATLEVRALLDQRSPVAKTLALYHGHLEGVLARHWPELGRLIDVHTTRSWMSLLKKHPGPAAVAVAGDEAAALLRKASRQRLSEERAKAVVDAARTTLGVPMVPGEQAKMKFLVEQIEHQTQQMDGIDEALGEVVSKSEEMTRMASLVGPACAAAVVSHVGSTLEIASARAFEKSIGLNMKERSSGEKKGRVSITKRGPAQVRQLLYLAALRLLNTDPVVFAWYRARRSYGGESGKKKAVVAVMRKLARALWHVGRGATFDATKLFDVRRLDLPVDNNKSASSVEGSTPTETTSAPEETAPRASSRHKPQRQGGIAQQSA